MRTADGETGHRFPWFLPDGTHFLFAAVPSKSNQFAIYSAAVGSTARELVLTAETAPLYAEPGYLIYSRNGVLVAHPFDARSRTISGEAISIGDMPGEVNLEYSAGWAASVSRTGSLIYLSAAQSRSRLAWLDQTGREVGAVNVPPAPYFGVGLARDGQQAVVAQISSPRSSLWLADLIRGGLTPIAEATAFHSNPIWSGLSWKRDGSQLLILGDRLDLVLVDVRLTPTFAVGATRVVGKLNFPIIAANSIDATADLGRMLAAIPEADGARFMTVVLNWRTRDAQQRP